MDWQIFMAVTRSYRASGWRGGLITSGQRVFLVGIGTGLGLRMPANDNGSKDRSATKD